jgi:hypothetical protein
MQDLAHATEEKLVHMVEMHGESSEFINSRRQAYFKNFEIGAKADYLE